MGVRVAVVGGGVAGLAAAWQVVSSVPSAEVILLEASPQVGGKLALERVGGRFVDVGAESMLARRPEALALAAEIGAAHLLTHPSGLPASIVSGGDRHAMPRHTLMGIPGDPTTARGLLTDSEVARALSEAPAAAIEGDVAVGSLVEERLGAAVTDKLVEPLLAGVYAGHSRELSLELAIPPLFAAARAGRSLLDTARDVASAAERAAGGTAPPPIFATLAGGLGQLPLLLADALRQRGVQIRLDATVRAVEATDSGWQLTTGPTIAEQLEDVDALVLATPAAPTARLLARVAPEAAAELASIEYASMAIVTFAFDSKPDHVAGSSGFLVPPTEGLAIKASTFSSAKWPWLREASDDTTFVRASLGRHREELTLQHGDGALIELALTDLRTVLGDRLPDPADAHVKRWGGGLPQYAVGHRTRIDRVRAALAAHPRPIAVGGAAYDGVGIPASIGSGRRAAAEVLTRLVAAGATLG